MIRYPDEYVESLLTNIMAYWYPAATSYEIGGDTACYHMLIGLGNEIGKKSYFPAADGFYNYLFFYQNFKKLPLISMLFRPALYFWAYGFYLLVALYRKRYQSLAALTLPLLYFGTVFFGPMTAIRYIYNLVVFLPILITCFCSDVYREAAPKTTCSVEDITSHL